MTKGTPLIIARAVLLYERGASMRAVGRRFEVNASTVLRWLRRGGVPPRPTITADCAACGAVFLRDRMRRERYCSASCQRVADHERRKRRKQR